MIKIIEYCENKIIKESELNDKYARKQLYINKKNKENRSLETNTLSENQIDVIEWLCKIRHEIHSNLDSYWLGNGNWNYFDNDSVDSINYKLKSVNLPSIPFSDFTDIPTVDDYYEFEDTDYWDSVAEQLQNNNSKNIFALSGVDVWKDKTDSYETFLQCMDNYNKQIEKYLMQIDKENGTNYAPSGWARLR